ncbi:hypothetical protein [Paenibacillus aquistagni]|uniref:hypothetical protein n=1 Tax=Paenibacillus aquistagni TaxID=1852522 RepID=UPI00197F4F63|nr:hypothetical protein [Paenibacillus aquistagni]
MHKDRIDILANEWMEKQRKSNVVVLSGRLVVEDGLVSLQLDDGELVELNTNDRIEVLNGERFEPAPYSRILEKVDSAGWSLCAGLYASVIRRRRHPTTNETLNTENEGYCMNQLNKIATVGTVAEEDILVTSKHSMSHDEFRKLLQRAPKVSLEGQLIDDLSKSIEPN